MHAHNHTHAWSVMCTACRHLVAGFILCIWPTVTPRTSSAIDKAVLVLMAGVLPMPACIFLMPEQTQSRISNTNMKKQDLLWGTSANKRVQEWNQAGPIVWFRSACFSSGCKLLWQTLCSKFFPVSQWLCSLNTIVEQQHRLLVREIHHCRCQTSQDVWQRQRSEMRACN